MTDLVGHTAAVQDLRDLRVASNETTVAVVITTYNHAHYLLDAIQSVVNQTRRADDIVVVDDGSSDDPTAVVAQCAGVRLLRQNNQGLAAARNAGLSAVGCDKVVFLDADDRLLPEALGAGLARFAGAGPDCGLVYGAYRNIDRHGRPVDGRVFHHPAGVHPYRDLLRGNVIGMHATVMYDRRRLVECGAFDPSLARCEDYDVYLRMAQSGGVASHPTLVAEYRWHDANMSHDHRSMLAWALRVHDRHASAMGPVNEFAEDWMHGRRVWRRYYASEMLAAARRQWKVNRSLGAATSGVLNAVRASPRTVAAAFVRPVRQRIGHLLRPGQTPPAVHSVLWGDLARTAPVSDEFGYDRGTPVDRYYIEQFLQRHAADITGRVLEIGDDAYSRRFGGARIEHQDVLHVLAGNPAATIVGDLSQQGTLPANVFDCLVLTQTLHLIFDMHLAVAQMHHSLKPGGVVLLTVPGITRIDRGEWRSRWYWSLTPAAAMELFSRTFGAENVRVESHGNVYAATAFLQGLALEEVDRGKLSQADECFPVIVTVRACRRRFT